MQALTIRDVELMMEGGATVTDVRLVRVPYKGKSYYQIEFTLSARGSAKRSLLITTRNEPHRWVDLNRAVNFVEQVFPGVQDISLLVRT